MEDNSATDSVTGQCAPVTCRKCYPRMRMINRGIAGGHVDILYVELCDRHSAVDDLLEAAGWALRTLESLARQEAERLNSTFELCDYNGAKALRSAIKRAGKEST